MARLSDSMEAAGYFGLERLPDEVRQFVKPGDWTIDVGANVGLLTGELCALVGREGLVWAVEPVPRNVQRLEQFRRANDLEQLMIYGLALADVAGTAELKLPARLESGWASFTASWNTGDVIEVTTATLDELILKAPPERRLAFIKIDAEGAEPRILAGARMTLGEKRPWVLCEFNEPVLRDAGSSSKELLSLFEGLGYFPAERFAPRGLDLLLRPS